MYHNYRYQVRCIVPGTNQRVTYNGMYTNMRSEAEAIAALKRNYPNLIDYDIWEV